MNKKNNNNLSVHQNNNGKFLYQKKNPPHIDDTD